MKYRKYFWHFSAIFCAMWDLKFFLPQNISIQCVIKLFISRCIHKPSSMIATFFLREKASRNQWESNMKIPIHMLILFFVLAYCIWYLFSKFRVEIRNRRPQEPPQTRVYPNRVTWVFCSAIMDPPFQFLNFVFSFVINDPIPCVALQNTVLWCWTLLPYIICNIKFLKL